MADPGVYVNNRSACSKAASGWSPAATPDPCVSPGPVVVPYPNTSKATDLKTGTTTVFIKNKMVSQKNKSYFSTSMGDEPATPSLSKGVATGVIKGKSYFTSWSQNVKFEGLAVNRHQDLMTHNHGSFPGNTPTFPYIDKNATGGNPCKNEEKEMTDKCNQDNGISTNRKRRRTENNYDWRTTHCENLKEAQFSEAKATEEMSKLDASEKKSDIFEKKYTSVEKQGQPFSNQHKMAAYQDKKANANDCIKARKCNLVPYKGGGCCSGQTGHHLVSDASVKDSGCSTYNPNHAPTVCVEGMSWHTGSHRRIHIKLAELNQDKCFDTKKLTTPLTDAIDLSVKSLRETFKGSNCSEGCIKKQLTNYYEQCCGSGLSQIDAKLVDEQGKELKSIPESRSGSGGSVDF